MNGTQALGICGIAQLRDPKSSSTMGGCVGWPLRKLLMLREWINETTETTQRFMNPKVPWFHMVSFGFMGCIPYLFRVQLLQI